MRQPFCTFLLAAVVACLATTHPTRAAAIAVSPATPTTASGANAVDAWVRFKAGAATSSDLRVRIAMSESSIEERDGLAYVAPDPSLESLVDQARGSTDPVALWLLTGRCGQMGADHRRPCDPVAMAERWTMADTQNQAAWLTLAAALDWAGRHAEARDALLRGSQASTWREYQRALARAIAAQVPTSGIAPRQRLSLLEAALSVGFSTVAPFSTLGVACRDRTLRDACLRYLDVIARDADNVIAWTHVAIDSARAGAPADLVAARSRKVDASMYAMTMQQREDDAQDDADVDGALRRVNDRLATSESARIARYLSDAHLTEDEAARRFVAGLTEDMRRRRAETVQPRSPGTSRSDADDS